MRHRRCIIPDQWLIAVRAIKDLKARLLFRISEHIKKLSRYYCNWTHRNFKYWEHICCLSLVDTFEFYVVPKGSGGIWTAPWRQHVADALHLALCCVWPQRHVLCGRYQYIRASVVSYLHGRNKLYLCSKAHWCRLSTQRHSCRHGSSSSRSVSTVCSPCPIMPHIFVVGQ